MGTVVCESSNSHATVRRRRSNVRSCDDTGISILVYCSYSGVAT